MEIHEQFDKWLAQADATIKELGSQKPASQQPRTSYFNNAPSDGDYEESDEMDGGDWHDIYRRALEVDFSDDADEGDLLQEQGDDPSSDGYDPRDGFNHMVRGDKQATKGNISYFRNPQSGDAVGPDAGKEYDSPMRVTQNFNQGKELEEVDEIKHEVEAMEREIHKQDVFQKKDSRDRLQKQVESLRTRLTELSEKMQSQYGKDVT